MIGWMARSKAGRDKDSIYIIIEEKPDEVLLADGQKRPLSKPKTKKKKHIQVIKRVPDTTLADKIENGIPCRDEEIKRAIKLYKQNVV